MSIDKFSERIIEFFTSLRLTVICLVLGMVLVFLGTMAQEPMGLYLAQEEFFQSFFVPAGAFWAAMKKTLQMVGVYLAPSTAAEVMAGPSFPAFPGGYLVGGVLLINLVASCLRLSLTWDKAGIWMVHLGLILLLLGQLGTDLMSRESNFHLREGETKNYSESDREGELAIIDTTDPTRDKVVVITDETLAGGGEIRISALPFTVKVNRFLRNSIVDNRPADSTEPVPASKGIGPRASVKELPRVTEMGKRDIPSVVIEIVSPEGSLGTWLVSEYIAEPQFFSAGGRTFQISMRQRRFYKDFSLQLLDFKHDLYPGTEIPKNFSSRVLLNRPDTGEKREVLIYMNNPLRYAGETFYQSGFDPDNKGTILQVVRNPSWLTPYFSCVLVGVGLLYQFMTHLLGFTFKRRTA